MSPLRVARRSLVVTAGNKGSTGPFAPIVVVVRNAMGVKQFNQLRGKAISLHSQGAGCRRPQQSAGHASFVQWLACQPQRLSCCPRSSDARVCAVAVIKDFCKQLGADTKQAQGLIRTAKKNGEWLGFLA